MATEADRILAEYSRRDRELPSDQYSLGHPHNLFVCQQKSRLLLKLLVDEGAFPVNRKTILDVGCGEGQQLLEFIGWGARRSELAGIDLIESRVAEGRRRLGGDGQNDRKEPDLRVGDASRLPWAADTFDIVHQGTVFTSILDHDMRAAVASEIVRVLKPSGLFVWYDFRFNNPQNPHVRGIGAREIRSLFPACTVRLKTLTLAPPLAKRVVPISWMAALFLEKLSVLNTHYLALIRKGRSR